jgi:hypothetical protein
MGTGNAAKYPTMHKNPSRQRMTRYKLPIALRLGTTALEHEACIILDAILPSLLSSKSLTPDSQEVENKNCII